MKRLPFAIPALAAAALLSGCSTPVLRLTMDEPGEFKLTDVSKIAIADFNTLPDDPFAGTGSADPKTCALVQRAVSAALSRSGAWNVARMDVEAAAAAFDGTVMPNRRFDAIAYGRVWWSFPPERSVLMPELFTLETKTRVAYQVPETTSSGSSLGSLGSSLNSLGSALGKLGQGSGNGSGERTSQPAETRQTTTKMVEKHVDLVTEKRDVLEKSGHRAREATLVLALSIYRVRADGTIEKITDTFIALDQSFSIDNGRYATSAAAFGPPDADRPAAATEAQEGATVLPERLSTIPSDLQAKLMLAARAAEDLGRRIAPHKVVRAVPYDFSDRKLQNLLQNRAWDAAERYALRSLRNALGAEIAAKVDPLKDYPKPDYEVPPSRPGDVRAVETAPDSAAAVERIVGRRDGVDALFALAVCQEATGRAEEALYTYRYVFRISPEAAPAEGIARCHEALGAAARIAEQARTTRKAGARASFE